MAALAAGIAFVAASNAAAHQEAVRLCSTHHQFGKEPVPVVKTADRSETLAHVTWGYSTEGAFCYLILDDAATATLRASTPHTAPPPPRVDPVATPFCSTHHQFGKEPVPVAKSADRSENLAYVTWGYSTEAGFCYLILDDAATATLRAAAQPDPTPDPTAEPTPDPTPDPTAEPTPDPTPDPTAEPTPDPLPIPANPPNRVSVGQFHACYLDADAAAVCVNANRFYGQALTGAPGGRFASISSGYRHSCGLRTTGAVECWGDDQYGPYLAPIGQFAAVSAGGSYSCGLRTTGAIECWGHQDDKRNPIPANDNRLVVPPGQYAAVSAANAYACGLRTDSTVSCWGREWLLREWTLDIPDSRFTAISTGFDHACGIRPDRTIECWGGSYPPTGEFTDIASGFYYSCGLRTDGIVECWGRAGTRAIDAPAGKFTEISAQGQTSCGIRIDQVAVCWGAIKRPFEGAQDVHVFYCTSRNAGYSNADLQREVQALNDKVGTFFTEQSSGMATLNFVAGGVVSPDIPWDQHEMYDLAYPGAPGGLYGEPCESAIAELGDYPQLLVLAGLKPGGLSGFARIEGSTGLASSATLEARYSSSCSPLSASDRVRDLGNQHGCSVYDRYYYVITHELGHTVFGLDHDLDCSVMSYNCQDNSRLGCTHLLALGWPHEDHCERDQLMRSQSGSSFTVVQSGNRFYCGLRTDGTISCWGDWSYGQTNAPSGTFTAISVHNNHACGLRTDRTVACWGRNDYGQANAPSGTFTSIRTWPFYSCGVRDDGSTECWGDQTIGKVKSYVPGGQFTAVAAGAVHWCGLRHDQTIVCDGFYDSPAIQPPSGTFYAIHANGDYSCGSRSDQTWVCWGEDGLGQSDPPAGQFTDLGAGWFHACGLRPDQTIDCWYYDLDVTRLQLDFGQDHAPSGQFTTMSVGAFHACGLRPDQTIACWGYNGYGQAEPPAGQFTAVSAGGRTTCGLRINKTIVCWGENENGQAEPPAGQFTAISAGVHGCGLRINGTVACWGQNASGEGDPPSGQFIAVTTGGQHSCGIRPDRTTVVCWGVVPE